MIRGHGTASKGIPQGSPLSPVLFLVWMSPILKEMQRRVGEEVRGVRVEFPSYVDDLHCGLYDMRRQTLNSEEVERRESMEYLLDRVGVVVKEVAREWDLPLAPDKTERIVLRERTGRRGKRGDVEKVKWLGVILDEELSCTPHWKSRIEKARNLLGAISRVGKGSWGMSPLS